MSHSDRPRADKVFLILAGTLLLFGLVMLSSATTVVAFERFQDNYYFVKQQIIHGFLPGLVLFFIFRYLPYRFLKSWSGFFYLAAVILLSAVFIPGVGLAFGGARRWIALAGINIQPSEIAKFLLIVFLAAWFAKRIEKRESQGTPMRESLLPFVVIMTPIVLPIIFQPDIGTLIVFVLISLAIYFLAGVRFRHLLFLAVCGLAGFWLLVKLAPYRMARITAFLNPEADPQGSGYHIQQALLAVGSGGLFGVGLGRSQQKFLYLPEVAGDSIFAIVAEELGFVFTTLVILLFLAFIYRGLQIAFRSRDVFGYLIVVGGMAWIGFQTIINIGAMIGMFPLTGIPLPFVSFGGTALAMLMAMVGLIANISTQRE